jgi:hypothetical protein
MLDVGHSFFYVHDRGHMGLNIKEGPVFYLTFVKSLKTESIATN